MPSWLFLALETLNGCSSAVSNALIYNVTGLDLITAEWKLQIAPNPTEGKLMITYSGVHKLDLEVFDMTGRQLLTSKHIPNSYSVNLSMYVNGTYLIHLTNSKTKQEVKKLIVKM